MKHIIMTGKTYALDASAGQIASAGGRTLHEMLVPFPVAYFTAAFVTDLVYWRNPDILWERFSVWLIAGGLVMAACVAVAAVIDLAFRRQRPTWLRWTQCWHAGTAAALTCRVANGSALRWPGRWQPSTLARAWCC